MSILYDYQPRSNVLVIDRIRVRSIGSTNQKQNKTITKTPSIPEKKTKKKNKKTTRLFTLTYQIVNTIFTRKGIYHPTLVHIIR